MKIRLYSRDDVAVLEPSGQLMGGQDVGELDEKLYALLGKQQKKVVIDLGKTAWLTSSAIAVLLHHHSKFHEIGGKLKIANLTQKVQQIIAITKLTLVFEIYDTLDAALGSFTI